MKLAELKSALVEKFFSDSSSGVNSIMLDEVYAALGKKLKADFLALYGHQLVEEKIEGISSDASKGFKKFTDGRKALLTIIEEDGSEKKAIFAAARSGKKISYVDLTVKEHVEKIGDLATVKAALKQAKNHNDEAYFNIKNGA